ncbi:MAG: hypothetical protein ABMA13_20230 [Chthoniobacteraceae bacterium]
MKTHLIIALALLIAATPAFAQSRDTELRVERRTLDRQDKIAKPRQNAHELTRGLHITVKNIGLGATAEGEVEWAILVARPGMQKALLDTGKEKLKALRAAEVATFDVGSIAVQDIAGGKQDMEYQVIVHRGGAEVAKVESKASFSQLAESARGAGKKGKKKK